MNKKLKVALRSIAAVTLIVGLTGGVASAADASPLSTRVSPQIGIVQHSQSTQSQKLARLVKSAQSSISSIKKASPGTYSKVQITAKNPGTIIYLYRFAKHVDPSVAKPYFTDSVALLKRAVKASVFPSMRSVGLTGTLHIVYKYENSNGSTIWKKTFTSKP